MKLLALVPLLVLILTGCGTTASMKDFSSTGFVMASQGEAGGIWKVIKGAASYCKMTTHGDGPKNYRITLVGGVCTIDIQE